MAAAGGEVLLKGMPLQHMKSTIQLIGKLGAELQRDGYDVKAVMNGKPNSVQYICTAPYPGFPTDLQSPLLTALCRCEGVSCIEERVFENRFLIVEELKKMGAKIHVAGQTAYVFPAETLHGADLNAKDLRGGAALVIAALEAEGNSRIYNADVIFRGYEDISKDLKSLGANIQTFL